MGIFSNILNQFKSAGQILKENISAGAKAVSSFLTSPVSSTQNKSGLASSLDLFQNTTSTPSIYERKDISIPSLTGGSTTPQVITQNTPSGLIAADKSGNKVVDSQGRYTIVPSGANISAQQNSFVSAAKGGIRPASVSDAQLEQGLRSAGFNQSGDAYSFNDQNQLFIRDLNTGAMRTTPQGFAGYTGSASGISGFGSTGTPGISGGRANFTGLLSGAGGLLTPSVASAAEISPQEEKRKTGSLPLIGEAGLQTKDGFNLFDLARQQLSIAQQAKSTPIVTEKFSAGAPSQSFDLGKVTDRVGEIQGLVSSPLTAQSRQELFNELGSLADQLKTQYQNISPLPELPVIDTPEQQEFLQNLPDPYSRSSAQQQMDQMRVQLRLPDLERQRIDLQNQINGYNEAFQKIVKDIRDNPNFPKSLAARRIQAFAEDTGIVLSNLQGQLNIVDSQIDNANQELNRAFEIYKFDQANQQNAIESNRQLLNQLISSGGITELNSADIQGFASMLGVPAKTLAAIQKSVAGKQQEYSNFYTQTNDNGDMTIIGVDNKGNAKALSTIKGVGTTTKATGNGGNVKLSVAQQDDIATMDTVVALAQDVLSLEDKFPGVGGLGSGSIQQFLSKNFGYGSEEEQNVRNSIGNIKGTIAKLRGGTSFTKDEQKLLETYTPTINDSDLMIKSKLNGLIDFINTKKQNLLNVAAGNYSGQQTQSGSGQPQSTPADDSYADQILNSL